MSILKIICITVVLLACTCDDEVGTTKQPADSTPPMSEFARKRIESARQFRDLFTLKQTVHLETTKESLIGRIESILYLNNEKKFVIFDSNVAKSVFVFNETGQFLYRIGKNGQGPGEYQRPKAIAYGDNKIAVYDISGNKLLFYTLAGRYLRALSFAGQQHESFYPEKMVFLNNDLYLYLDNWYLSRQQGEETHRVFRLKNGDKFDRGFGSPEETFAFEKGKIISSGNNIYYTGVFDGIIYQIDPVMNTHSVFGAMGILTDLSKARQSQNPLQYLLTHFDELDFVVNLGILKNALFVVTRNVITVFDLTGKMVRKDLPNTGNFLPTDDDDLASRLGFSFYKSGIIVAANLALRITEDNVPNPSLLLYEFIDN